MLSSLALKIYLLAYVGDREIAAVPTVDYACFETLTLGIFRLTIFCCDLLVLCLPLIAVSLDSYYSSQYFARVCAA